MGGVEHGGREPLAVGLEGLGVAAAHVVLGGRPRGHLLVGGLSAVCPGVGKGLHGLHDVDEHPSPLLLGGVRAGLVDELGHVERHDDRLGAACCQFLGRGLVADRAGDELREEVGFPRSRPSGGDPLGAADVGGYGPEGGREEVREVHCPVLGVVEPDGGRQGRHGGVPQSSVLLGVGLGGVVWAGCLGALGHGVCPVCRVEVVNAVSVV